MVALGITTLFLIDFLTNFKERTQTFSWRAVMGSISIYEKINFELHTCAIPHFVGNCVYITLCK